MSNEYYTLKEVAERFRKTPRTVRRWIDEGRLEGVKVRGRILIPKEALQSLEHPLEPSSRPAGAKNNDQHTNCGTATMSRREFLRDLSVATISGATVLVVERFLGRWYDLWRARRQEVIQREEKARDLFGELLGAPYKMRSFDAGTHPDNLAAGRALAPVLGLYDSKPIPVPGMSQIKILPEGDVVLVGGPTLPL
jgi:excisionase family DNA binding protein